MNFKPLLQVVVFGKPTVTGGVLVVQPRFVRTPGVAVLRARFKRRVGDVAVLNTENWGTLDDWRLETWKTDIVVTSRRAWHSAGTGICLSLSGKFRLNSKNSKTKTRPPSFRTLGIHCRLVAYLRCTRRIRLSWKCARARLPGESGQLWRWLVDPGHDWQLKICLHFPRRPYERIGI